MPYLFTGSQVNINGVVMVYYFGKLISLVNNLGEILWRDEYYPVYLVEYLLKLPDPNSYKWN